MDPVSVAGAAWLCVGALLVVVVRRPGWVIDRAPWVIGATLLATVLSIGAFVRLDPPSLRLGLDPSSEPLIPSGDPAHAAYLDATRSFGTDDLYVVALETDDVFSRSSLEALRDVTRQIRRLDGVRAAESLVDVLSFRYLADEDLVDVGRLIDEIPEDDAALAELRARALGDPLYRDVIVSRDGRGAAINVSFRPMTDGEFLERDLDGEIQRIVARAQSANARFHVSGRPHVRAAAHALMVGDLLLLTPIAIVLAAAVVLLLTGSLRAVLVPLSSCGIATLWTLGAMASSGHDMNVVTLVLAPTLICVGSVYGVHVLARFESIAAEGSGPRDVANRCLTYCRLPVLIAGFTTSVGFGALVLSDIPATRELGAFAIFGVASITLLSLTYVPAVLSRLPASPTRAAPLRAASGVSARLGRGIDRVLEGLANFSARWSTPALAAWGVAALASVALIPRISVDTDFLRFFDADSDVRREFAAVNRLLAGTVPIFVTLDGANEGSFREPRNLQAAHELQQRIRDIDGVSHVNALTDLVASANGALDHGRPEEMRIPETRREVAEVVFLIPKGVLRRFASSNHSRINLIVRTGELGSASIRRLESEIRSAIREVKLPAGIRADVVGNATLLSHSADQIASDQLTQVGFAAVAILILICAVFRSISVGLLAMVPNVVPVLIYFGALGGGLTTLSLPTSLIGCVALGIAVDDTVHFLVAYRAQRTRGEAPDIAIREVIHTVGRPIVISSLTLAIGFLALLMSGFATLREFGALVALTMIICLATDLSLLPALLARARA